MLSEMTSVEASGSWEASTQPSTSQAPPTPGRRKRSRSPAPVICNRAVTWVPRPTSSSYATSGPSQLKLEPEIRQNLRKAATELGKTDWRAREILVALRQSFIVPVPGLLTERVMAAAAAE